jgi:hypothetical protein
MRCWASARDTSQGARRGGRGGTLPEGLAAPPLLLLLLLLLLPPPKLMLSLVA